MSKIYDWGRTYTNATNAFTMYTVGDDWKQLEEERGRYVEASNSAALGQTTTNYKEVRTVQNVYRDLIVPNELKYANKAGTKMYCQIVRTVNVTDDSDPTYQRVLPLRASITIEVPNVSDVTPNQTLQLVRDLVTQLFKADDTNNVRSANLFSQLRGFLKL